MRDTSDFGSPHAESKYRLPHDSGKPSWYWYVPLICQPPSTASIAVFQSLPQRSLRPNGRRRLVPIEKRFGRSFGDTRSSSTPSAGLRKFSWSRVDDRVYCAVSELPLRKRFSSCRLTAS